MYHTLIFLVLSQVAGPPVGPPVHPPVNRTTPVVVATPATTQPANTPEFAPTFDPTVVRAEGLLHVPEWNKVGISAPVQAVLMSLKTEQRDAAGNVVLLPLRKGMHVVKDQVLGHFDDRELVQALAIAEAQLEVAIAERDKTIEIEHAKLAAKVAGVESAMLQRANELSAKTVSEIEIYKAGLAEAQAKAQHALHDYTINQVRTREAVVREKEVEAAKIRIEQRKLRAPISGLIVNIVKAEGEWFREGDPVLEILQLDTLWAKCSISGRYDPAALDGKEAAIRIIGGAEAGVDDNTEEFSGKVVFVDPRIQIGNICEIFIEVQNRAKGRYWQLRPGQQVSVTIPLQ